MLDTGEPLEINRRGRRLRLVADEPVDRLARIRTEPGVIIGDPEDLVQSDWSSEWDVDRSVEP